MKKIISVVLLICIFNIVFISCDNGNLTTSDANEKNDINSTPVEHDNINGKCSVCNLEYFDVLWDIVAENGIPYTNSVTTEADGIIDLIVDDGHIVFRIWKNSPERLNISYYKYASDYYDSYSYLSMTFDRANVKYGEYTWSYNTDRSSFFNNKSIRGTLVAADLKEITQTVTYSSDDNVVNADFYASLVTGYIIKIAKVGIPTALAYGDCNTSAKHFGFKYFD